MPNLTIKRNHRVRKDVQDALLQNYWDSKGEVLGVIGAVLEKHHMILDVGDCPGDEGHTAFRILAENGYKYICSSCTNGVENPAFDNCISFSWYRMGSGKWEIVGYVT